MQNVNVEGMGRHVFVPYYWFVEVSFENVHAKT
jgi:hypothetical protein